jgi:5-aminopentanamidase
MGEITIRQPQAPLLPAGMDALDLARTQVKLCESECVTILCCPEAVLGGLADNHPNPSQVAITANSTTLGTTLSPLASETVTTIIGFTELGDGGRIYNSAAVFRQGEIVGLYRKLYPAIRRSVYSAGHDLRVFRNREFTFGIAICNDSNHPELARLMAEHGATVLFVPTNNGLPANRNGAELAAKARECDRATAWENGMWVIRADVAGDAGGLISYGSSEIVDPGGTVVRSARPMTQDLVIADIDVVRRTGRHGADALQIAVSVVE